MRANRPARLPQARGFTLIEVLAALVIVALGMLGVIEAVTQSARNGTYLRDKTLAHWIAMNVITERRMQAAAPDVGDTSDDVDFAGQRWHWTMKVSQTQVQSMRRMDVSVRAADGPEDSALVTVTGFYGTAIAPSGGGALNWGGIGGTGAGAGTGTGGSQPQTNTGQPGNVTDGGARQPPQQNTVPPIGEPTQE